MSTTGDLRQATRACHDHVDAAFSGFDLADPGDYARFLLAHARATGAAEGRLAEDPGLPAWRARLGLVVGDLASLGLSPPPPLAFGPATDQAWRWGVLYVLEGSRLGASVLVQRTPPGTPNAYLGSRHLPGEWRRLLASIDREGDAQDAAWTEAAIAGARACFALYGSAASG